MKNSEGVLAEEQQERVKKDHRSNSAIDFKHLLYLIIFWMEWHNYFCLLINLAKQKQTVFPSHCFFKPPLIFQQATELFLIFVHDIK